MIQQYAMTIGYEATKFIPPPVNTIHVKFYPSNLGIQDILFREEDLSLDGFNTAEEAIAAFIPEVKAGFLDRLPDEYKPYYV
ncbi:MAG: hypothetical protein AAB680_05490 [Pseudomonadota bacterium]